MIRQTGGFSCGRHLDQIQPDSRACRSPRRGDDAQLGAVGADDAHRRDADLFVDPLLLSMVRLLGLLWG